MQKTFKWLLCLLMAMIVIVSPMTTMAADTSIDVYADMEKKVFEDGSGASMPYRLYVPESYDASKKYPVVVFLHGAGERGSDNSAQLVNGIQVLFDTHEAFKEAIVIAPQCPATKRWVETDWSAGCYSSDLIGEEQLATVMKILESVQGEYSTDTDRIYAMGLSMGGFGTWDLLTRHHDVFAAGVPICGSGDPNKADILSQVPIWTFHDTTDGVVPYNGTKTMYNSIKAAGGDKIKFTTYNQYAHAIWNVAAAEPGLVDWLFSQRLSERNLFNKNSNDNWMKALSYQGSRLDNETNYANIFTTHKIPVENGDTLLWGSFGKEGYVMEMYDADDKLVQQVKFADTESKALGTKVSGVGGGEVENYSYTYTIADERAAYVRILGNISTMDKFYVYKVKSVVDERENLFDKNSSDNWMKALSYQGSRLDNETDYANIFTTHKIEVAEGDTLEWGSFGKELYVMELYGANDNLLKQVQFTETESIPLGTTVAGVGGSSVANYNHKYTITTSGAAYVRILGNISTMDKFYVYKTSNEEVSGESILFVGDSITNAIKDDGNKSGWAGRVGNSLKMAWTNAGVSGASVSTIRPGNRVLTQLQAHKNTEFDYVILHGGVNDAMDNGPVGRMSDSYNVEDFDTTTFAGGLEELFAYAIKEYEGSRIGYIVNYATPNSTWGGSTKDMSAYFTVAKQICDKWDIPYLNLYDGTVNVDGEELSYSYDILEMDKADSLYAKDLGEVHIGGVGYDRISPYIAQWVQTLPMTKLDPDVSEYVKQLIVYYRDHQENAQTDIERVLAEMAEVNPERADVWTQIMDYWSYINTDMTVNINTVPEGLPTDDSMVVVILGFQLNSDGTMKDELIGRLETGLAIAEAYPNCYVAVTGGGTASGNPSVTEGGLMGQWLLDQGVSADRLIIENKAPSTVGNAENTYKILNEEYPQVKSFVMVTSDYHVPRGCILFYSKCLLAAHELGGETLELISNGGHYTGSNGYESISLQASGVASVAGVSLSGVNVTLSELESLKVTQNTLFQPGNELDITVEALYDSGYVRDVTDLAAVTGFDASQSAEQEITVSYTENGITYQVTMKLTETEAELSEKVKLDAMITEAEAISGATYTKKSFEILTEAIEAAKDVMADENASKETVIAAKEAIKAAIENLHTKVNIARGMTVAANCNQDNASKITNGSTADYWESRDGNGNVASADAEFVIDLDGTFDVEAVRVYPYYRSGQQRNYQYELFGSTDNETWFPIGKNESDEYVTADGITHEMDVQVSYVKLKGISTVYVGRPDVNNIHIQEMQIFGEEVDNIALYKPVTSSGSDQSAASSSGATDAKINDGDRTTYWDAGLYANKPWAVVDLGGIYALDEINVITYWQRTRYYQYEIYTSIDGVEYTKAAEKTSDVNETVFGEEFTFEEPVQAAYIKLVGTYDSGNESFHLNELRAYGTEVEADYSAVDAAIEKVNKLNPEHYTNFDTVEAAIAAVVRGKNLKDQAVVDGYAEMIENAIAMLSVNLEGKNIACGAPVTANCNQSIAYRITNGTTDDYWESRENNANVAAADAEFVIDLDGSYQVDGVRVYPYWGGNRIYKYKLYGSTDNETWFPIGEHLSDEYVTSAGIAHRVDMELSYVKLVGVETRVEGRGDINNIHIKEVEVIGTETANLAANKPAYIGDSTENMSAYITDENRTTYWDAGAYANKPYTVIDLGEAYVLDTIKVINYWQATRYYQYEVYTSTDGVNYTKAAEKTSNENAAVYGDTYTFEDGILAKYIKVVGIFNSANSAFHLNEVRAYGTEFVAPDKAVLDVAIETVKDIKSEDYTDDSRNAFEEALEDAQAVKENPYASEQEIEAAAEALTAAAAALELKDADYTAVNAAKAAAEDLVREHYVDLSAVDAAVAAVVEGKKIDEQSAVDAMAEAINAAIAALKYKDADYTAVNAAKETVNSLVKENYKDFSAVEAAVAAVEEGKNITEQAAVDAFAKAITDAVAALEYKDADYAAVNAAIEAAEALVKTNYKDFSAVEAAIEAVLNGKNITEQVVVDEMAEAINDAVAALELRDANYTAVNEAKAAANALVREHYVDLSAVDAAVAAVVEGKKITEQAAVDAMAKAITDAIKALELKDADYSAVDAAKAAAAALVKENYKDFSKVERAVEAVVEGKKIDEQAAVDVMAKAITDAVAALELKDADYTTVDEALVKIPEDLDGYTKESVEALKAAVEAIRRNFDITKQDEVEAMAKAVEDAIAGLKKKPAPVPSQPSTPAPSQPISPATGDSSMITLYLFVMAAAVMMLRKTNKR